MKAAAARLMSSKLGAASSRHETWKRNRRARAVGGQRAQPGVGRAGLLRA